MLPHPIQVVNHQTAVRFDQNIVTIALPSLRYYTLQCVYNCHTFARIVRPPNFIATFDTLDLSTSVSDAKASYAHLLRISPIAVDDKWCASKLPHYSRNSLFCQWRSFFSSGRDNRSKTLCNPRYASKADRIPSDFGHQGEETGTLVFPFQYRLQSLGRSAYLDCGRNNEQLMEFPQAVSDSLQCSLYVRGPCTYPRGARKRDRLFSTGIISLNKRPS